MFKPKIAAVLAAEKTGKSALYPASALFAGTAEAAETDRAGGMSIAGQMLEKAVSGMSDAATERTDKASEEESRDTLLTGKQSVVVVPDSPEGYVLVFSDGTVVDEELMDDFRKFAFREQMSQMQAAQLAKFYEEYVRKCSARTTKSWQEQDASLRSACHCDPRIGGQHFEENMCYAGAAMERFGSPALREMLDQTGYGSHPDIVAFMVNIGRALAEKSMVMGQSAAPELSVAELFYPSMRKSR